MEIIRGMKRNEKGRKLLQKLILPSESGESFYSIEKNGSNFVTAGRLLQGWQCGRVFAGGVVIIRRRLASS